MPPDEEQLLLSIPGDYTTGDGDALFAKLFSYKREGLIAISPWGDSRWRIQGHLPGHEAVSLHFGRLGGVRMMG